MELIDWKELKRLGFPYARAHVQRLEDQGLFPKRRRLNPGAGRASRVAWVKQEYLDWVASRPT
jgi:predicted DNA-binding transcriptional regulator AlpA